MESSVFPLFLSLIIIDIEQENKLYSWVTKIERY